MGVCRELGLGAGRRSRIIAGVSLVCVYIGTYFCQHPPPHPAAVPQTPAASLTDHACVRTALIAAAFELSGPGGCCRPELRVVWSRGWYNAFAPPGSVPIEYFNEAGLATNANHWSAKCGRHRDRILPRCDAPPIQSAPVLLSLCALSAVLIQGEHHGHALSGGSQCLRRHRLVRQLRGDT